MVPLNQAEVYFSGQIKANPRDAFGHWMCGVARLENDDLEGASADLDESLKLDSVRSSPDRTGFGSGECLDQATADPGKAIEIDERNSFAFVERGIFSSNMLAGEEPGHVGNHC